MVVLPLWSGGFGDGTLVPKFGDPFARNDAESTEVIGANHVVINDSHHQHGSLHVHSILFWHRARWKKHPSYITYYSTLSSEQCCTCSSRAVKRAPDPPLTNVSQGTEARENFSLLRVTFVCLSLLSPPIDSWCDSQ